MSDGNSNILSHSPSSSVAGTDPAYGNRFVRRWRKTPEGSSETVVLCLHGIESHSGWFDQFAEFISNAGVDCFAYDRPGHGRSLGSELGSRESQDEIVADLVMVFSRLQEDYQRVVIVAMSWAGLLAAFVLSEGIIAPAMTVLLVPGIFPIRSLPLTDMLRVAWSVLSGRNVMVSVPLNPEDFSDDRTVVEKIRSDKMRRKEVSATLFYAIRRMQERVRKGDYQGRSVEIWISGSDRIIDNEATIVFAKMHGIPVQSFAGHGHCLVFECPEKIARSLLKKIGQEGHS